MFYGEENERLIFNNDEKKNKNYRVVLNDASLLTCTYCKYPVSPLDYILHVLYIYTHNTCSHAKYYKNELVRKGHKCNI